MSYVDLALIVLALVFALSGFRQGLIVSAASFVGFFGGAVLGAQLSGPIAEDISGSSGTRVFVAGAVVSAIAVLLVAWMVATPLASSPFPGVAGQVRQSALVQAVNRTVPAPVRSLYDSLRESIGRQGLPDVLDPLTPTRSRDVPVPDQTLKDSPVVGKVRGSVVQIRGIAASCSRQIDGSGFVYAPQRVMTNAHVLAGVSQPKVTAEGKTYDATAVYLDPEIDIAVLAVPG